MRPRALIITGDGLNCEIETSYAFRLAGAEPVKKHITEILSRETDIRDYEILAFIGGFSNGDHLGAGTVQAVRFRNTIKESILEFISNKKPIIGICNGFQTLIKIGILPGTEDNSFKRTCSLLMNDSAVFEDRWVYLLNERNSPCIWTKGIEKIFLPVRHGEGKFYTTKDILEKIKENNQIVFKYTDEKGNITEKYPYNPNGSIDSIAAICDKSGLIFGLMPHPEAFLHGVNNPYWTINRANGKDIPEYGEGLKIFKNAVEFCMA